eukprot:NODE_510_length_1859_cov_112.372979_g502_i0.p1 GENE.NODE_510_length_1859_cov_112.372979_g502_i0~~NODE_510_length_1859_cov_112.372979_g502_i0.p1  ORF type:complete len:320 (+),score=26.53 NODE_510_length_1859_cov_112.372979_g502_i0:63-1022(+)
MGCNTSKDDPTQQLNEEMLQACTDGNLARVVELLSVAGVDVRYRQSYSERSCILNACEQGRADLVDFLLQNGADADAMDRFGVSAYDLAKKAGNKELATRMAPFDPLLRCLSPSRIAAHSPMVLLPATELSKFDKIPKFFMARSRLLTLEEVRRNDHSVVVFVSHNWMRPDQDMRLSHPDDAKGSKLAALSVAVQAIADLKGLVIQDIYVWLDYSCMDQGWTERSAKARALCTASLPYYAAQSDALLCLMPSHMQTEIFASRGWCSFEVRLFYELLQARTACALFLDIPLTAQYGGVWMPAPLCQASEEYFSGHAERWD